jgi:hypothetical protein
MNLRIRTLVYPSRLAAADKTRARETDQHHGPGRGRGNCAADTKATRSVGNEFVLERQIDVEGSPLISTGPRFGPWDR